MRKIICIHEFKTKKRNKEISMKKRVAMIVGTSLIVAFTFSSRYKVVQHKYKNNKSTSNISLQYI